MNKIHDVGFSSVLASRVGRRFCIIPESILTQSAFTVTYLERQLWEPLVGLAALENEPSAVATAWLERNQNYFTLVSFVLGRRSLLVAPTWTR